MCFDDDMREPYRSRKLLIASVGVATINYVAACGHEPVTSGNLVAPPQYSGGMPASTGDSGVLVAGGTAGTAGEAAIPPTSGNLVAPPPPPNAPLPTNSPPTSGNLVPPPKPLPTGGVKPPLKAH